MPGSAWAAWWRVGSAWTLNRAAWGRIRARWDNHLQTRRAADGAVPATDYAGNRVPPPLGARAASPAAGALGTNREARLAGEVANSVAGGVIAHGGVDLAGTSPDRRPGWAEHQPGQGPILIPPLRRMARALAFGGSWGSERGTSQHRTAHHEDGEGEGEQPRPPTKGCHPVMRYTWPAWGRIPGLLLTWGIGTAKAQRPP
jgi:hypothetical protein